MSLHQTPSHTGRKNQATIMLAGGAAAHPWPHHGPARVVGTEDAPKTTSLGHSFIRSPEICAATPAHTNIFLIVSSCFFIFFLGHTSFFSTLAPSWGQQLPHLQCSLLPHGRSPSLGTEWQGHTRPSPGAPNHVPLLHKALHLTQKPCPPSSSSQGGMPSCSGGTGRSCDACAVL